MSERLEIARNWLPRYTGMELDAFGDYILLTNFRHYLNMFAEQFDCALLGVLCGLRIAELAKYDRHLREGLDRLRFYGEDLTQCGHGVFRPTRRPVDAGERKQSTWVVRRLRGCAAQVFFRNIQIARFRFEDSQSKRAAVVVGISSQDCLVVGLGDRQMFFALGGDAKEIDDVRRSRQ